MIGGKKCPFVFPHFPFHPHPRCPVMVRFGYILLPLNQSVCSAGLRQYGILPESDLTNCPGHANSTPTGLVLGMYCESGGLQGDKLKFTDSAKKYDDLVKGRLKDLVTSVTPLPKLGQVCIMDM